MRHRKHTRTFGRQRSHYKATLRHLVTGLILSKSIRTTKAKAKETSRIADKLITMGKNKTVNNQRRVFSLLQSKDLVKILFNDIAPLFKDRNGGYTRVMLTGRRHGDNAQMAILEFVEKPARPELKEKAAKEEKKAPVTKKEDEPKKITAPKKEKEFEKPKRGDTKKPGFFKKIFKQKKGL